MRRRRPLMRAAMIGGTAYVAGRAGQNAAMRQQEAESESQQQPQSQPQQPQESSTLVDQLNQLAQLHQSGALSDGDFEAAKQKLLAS